MEKFTCDSFSEEKYNVMMAALRNNIIPLLDEIERLQAKNERLKKEIDFAYKPL